MRRALPGLVILLVPRVLLAAEEGALPAFERVGLAPLPPDVCQELRVARTGAGVLEVRFFSEPLLRPTGPDPKTGGASLFLAADDLERASFALYGASGIYQQSARLAAPIRWMRHDTELCVSSGSRPVFCGPTAGELLGTVRIAFGSGWESGLTGCAAFPMPERSLGRRIAALAWRLPSPALLEAAASCCALLAVLALLGRRRSWRRRAMRSALALLATIALVRVPHPVATEGAVEPAVPPLWRDTASWHPRAPHQSLDFRGQPLAGIGPGPEAWLVLGGSVVFGEGVAASETFTAVAQDLFRAEGDPTVLLNAGMQGWNIQNIDRLLTDLGDALPVTGIVLVSILNNATLPIAGERGAWCDGSLVLAHLCNVSRSQLLLTWPKVFLPKPHNLERYRSTLRRLLGRELALGRRVVLLDEASEFDRGALSLWDADSYRATAAELAAESGVAFHSIAEAVEALPPGQRFLDGIHPTPALHALLGRELHAILHER